MLLQAHPAAHVRTSSARARLSLYPARRRGGRNFSGRDGPSAARGFVRPGIGHGATDGNRVGDDSHHRHQAPRRTEENATSGRLPHHQQARARLVRSAGGRAARRRFSLGAAKHLYAPGVGGLLHGTPRRRCRRHRQFHREVGEFGRQFLADGEVPKTVEMRVGAAFQSRISELQLADRQYWRDIIRRLKVLRGAGQLMPEGGNVSGKI